MFRILQVLHGRLGAGNELLKVHQLTEQSKEELITSQITHTATYIGVF